MNTLNRASHLASTTRCLRTRLLKPEHLPGTFHFSSSYATHAEGTSSSNDLDVEVSFSEKLRSRTTAELNEEQRQQDLNKLSSLVDMVAGVNVPAKVIRAEARKKAMANKVATHSAKLKRSPSNLPPPQLPNEARVKEKTKSKKGKRTKAKLVSADGKGEFLREVDVVMPRVDQTVSSWGPDRLSPDEQEMMDRRSPPHMLDYGKCIKGVLKARKVSSSILKDVEPDVSQRPVPRLSHGLDRVLFNPGVHWLRDPHSSVYNFSPWLEKIPKVQEFAFDRVRAFVKSSEDKELRAIAKREGKTFCGSTSSLSGLLSQAYFLISDTKEVDTSGLSRIFLREPRNFTPAQVMPVSVDLKYHDGVYAIDSVKTDESNDHNILLWMGHLLEKFLTVTPDVFKNYLRASPGPIEEENDTGREAFRFASSDRFVMRSQLDCQDPRLPGSGIFDIKTRACVPIRMDILNFEESSGYVIRRQQGLLESFEREYYDMIRSAFLKYSFQVRIGNMDGVIVAYHNTERIFGFQYIPLAEMDERLFGPGEGVGDRVFEKCVKLLETTMEEVVKCFPGEDLNVLAETKDMDKTMNVFIQPTKWDGEEEERPIKQLQVKAANYLGAEPVRPERAVQSGRDDWKVVYEIRHITVPESEMRQGLAAAKDRQIRSTVLPTGVGEEEVKDFLQTLQFGGEAGTSEGVDAPLTQKFRKAGSAVEALRELARQGREDTLRREEQEKGKPKIVLGMDEPWQG